MLCRLIATLFPPVRRSWRGGTTWALGIFAVLMIILAFQAARPAGWVRLGQPEWLWLSLLGAWFWWIAQAGKGAGGLGGTRAAIALFVRLLILGLFAVLLAEPRAVRRSDQLTLMYALDVSDSMGPKVTDQALGFILGTAEKRQLRDETGLVVFGTEPAVELPPRQAFPFEAINSLVGRDGSNLAEALSLSMALLPEGNDGRLVLLSDGRQTAGDLTPVLQQLHERGIPVDVLPVQYDFQREVWLERLELPKNVKQGESYEAGILLSSLQTGKGTLILSENGVEISRREVDFQTGKNRFSLPLKGRGPGFYEYTARVEVPPGQDGWQENNLAMNDLYLRGEGRVLLVTSPGAAAQESEPLRAVLAQMNRKLDVMPPVDFPRDARGLLSYDLAIFLNVAADQFDPMQLEAARLSVYEQGMGFLMSGGENSFGPGGWRGTAVETLLPVEMDVDQKKILPKGALAILLHTCEFAQGNTWAKRIAKEAIRVLGKQDEVGLLAYLYAQGGDKWVFPMTKVTEYDSLVQKINQAEPGDMPAFGPAMQLALTGLTGSDAALKHLILISDGDPSPPPPALVTQYQQAKISISTITINPHGGTDIAIMQDLAKLTGGRHYYPQNPEQLPSIFVKEAKTLKRNMVQNVTFVPKVEFPSPVLKGIETMPSLKGYVLTSAKARSQTVLRGPELEDINPVLSLWRYGAGSAGAWTSDLSSPWSVDFVAAETFVPFVRQLVEHLSRVERVSSLALQTYAQGEQGVISIEDGAGESSPLDISAAVHGPGDKVEEVKLTQTAPGRYKANMPLWGRGRYRISVAGVNAEREERALGGFSVPYSQEYLNFSSNPNLLRRIAAETGGRILTGQEKESFWDFPRQVREKSRPVLDWFFVALACLIPLDVAVRRVQLDFSQWGKFLKRNRTGNSTVTMEALLASKKASPAIPTRPAPPGPVRTAPTSSPSPKVEPVSREPLPPKPASPPVVPPSTGKDAPSSTSSALLDRKRRKQQGRENEDKS